MHVYKILYTKSSFLSYAVRSLKKKDVAILNKIASKKDFFEGKVSLTSNHNHRNRQNNENEENETLKTWKLVQLTFTKCQYATMKPERKAVKIPSQFKDVSILAKYK